LSLEEKVKSILKNYEESLKVAAAELMEEVDRDSKNLLETALSKMRRSSG